jgi:hypothetical protein
VYAKGCVIQTPLTYQSRYRKFAINKISVIADITVFRNQKGKFVFGKSEPLKLTCLSTTEKKLQKNISGILEKITVE